MRWDEATVRVSSAACADELGMSSRSKRGAQGSPGFRRLACERQYRSSSDKAHQPLLPKRGSWHSVTGSIFSAPGRYCLRMHNCACQSTLECVPHRRFVGTSLPLTDRNSRICDSGRTWSKKAIRCSLSSERHLVEARSAAGPIGRSRSGGVADLVGHRGRNGEEEASEGGREPSQEGLEEPWSGI